jgi:anti-sigma-K factor RskA
MIDRGPDMNDPGMDDPGMDDREGLAAEYVLGTLPLADRAEAERLIARDPGFAALVGDWTNRLAPLNEGYLPVAPPPGVLDRVEARLFPAPEPTRSAGPRWIFRLIGAAAAAAAAVAFALYLPGPATPPVVATLTGEAQDLIVTASFAPDEGRLTVSRTGGAAAGTGQDYQVWLIPAGAAPVPLGLLREAALDVPLAAMPPGTTLAISLEPSGGSPTGQPTGPVLVAAVVEG